MAVPSSGELSMYGIRHELYNNNYNGSVSLVNIGLTSLSTGEYSNGTINTANPSANRPNGSTPHEMSEFYAYDHDYVALTSFSALSNEDFGICGNSLTETLYHNGSGTLPSALAGDTIYEDSAGTTAVTSKYVTTDASLGGVLTNQSGVASATFSCGRR